MRIELTQKHNLSQLRDELEQAGLITVQDGVQGGGHRAVETDKGIIFEDTPDRIILLVPDDTPAEKVAQIKAKVTAHKPIAPVVVDLPSMMADIEQSLSGVKDAATRNVLAKLVGFQKARAGLK